MKWVKVGLAQAAGFVLIAALMDKDVWPALAGGTLAGTAMWYSYVHANESGLRNGGTPTETY